jgi:hypothetical protein
MQRGDDPGRPGLPHVIERDRVLLAEPAPSLFHLASPGCNRHALCRHAFMLANAIREREHPEHHEAYKACFVLLSATSRLMRPLHRLPGD